MPKEKNLFPVNPLDNLSTDADHVFRRRIVRGVLESYNGNYDMIAEGVQNSIDALEDAHLDTSKGPYLLEVTVDLDANTLGILDTGIGMSPQQITKVFAPCVSFKTDPDIQKKREKHPYRGYKGVGLTFLAYGTDDITIHSKQNGVLVKGRMQYGRAWAEERRSEPALIVEDSNDSPLEKLPRGTFVKFQFSNDTHPKSLSRLGSSFEAWQTILRVRTAAGQVLLSLDPMMQIDIKLRVISGQNEKDGKIEPTFLYPHTIKRQPSFRFLDLNEYYKKHAEQTAPPPEKLRQDGLYVTWDTERIIKEMSAEQQTTFGNELKLYTPQVYAFVPYQGSVWGDLNNLSTGAKHRTHLYPGLMLAVNGQRVADIFEIDASRFETFSRNVFVIVQFDNARPDQGRKTLQDEVVVLAKKIGDRVVQYLAKQRELLRPQGESPTPEQRQVEKDHGDWIFNVKRHAQDSPLHVPPVAYASTPLTEQDVVGLFNQFAAVGILPGIRVYATSQIKTYDCLLSFDCSSETPGLSYKGPEDNPLGVSPYVLGDHERFITKDLTLEFKNNLDALLEDVDGTNSKQYRSIDLCVCWGQINETFKGYHIEPIIAGNIDERQFPGVTHLIRKDGDTHVIQVIMLEHIVSLLKAGKVKIK